MKNESRLQTLIEEIKEDVDNCTEHQMKRLKSLIRSKRPTRMMIGRAKQFLTDCGFPTIQCSTEAERLCSSLSREGLVSSVYTSDSDVFAYGARCVLRIDRRNDNKLTKIYRRKLLDVLNFDDQQLIDFCVLNGCDYNFWGKRPLKKSKAVRGIGTARCVEIIHTYGSYENLPDDIFNVDDVNYDEVVKEFEHFNSMQLIDFDVEDEVDDIEEFLQFKERDLEEIEMLFNEYSIYVNPNVYIQSIQLMPDIEDTYNDIEVVESFIIGNSTFVIYSS